MAEAVTQVLNSSKAQVLPQWGEFLQDPNVGCQLNVTTSQTGGDPELTCTFTEAGLWSFKFDTSANSAQFGATDYNLGNSVIIGLPPNTTAPSTTPTLSDILQKFGVTDSSGNLPFDDGSYPSDLSQDGSFTPPDGVTNTTPPSPGTFVQTVVQKLGTSFSFQVDSTETRNTFWITPGQTMRADVALTFVPSGDAATVLNNLSTALFSHLGITPPALISSLKMVVQKTAIGYTISDTDESTDPPVTTTSIHVTSSYSLGFECTAGPFVFWITLNGSGMNLTVLQSPSSPPANFYTLTGVSKDSLTPVVGDILSGIEILKVSATVDNAAGTHWAITLGLNWGSFGIYLEYDSSTSTFSGGLILAGFYSTSADQLRPDFMASQAMIAPAGYIPTPSYDLRKLSTNLSGLPSSIPTSIITAHISYQTTSNILSLEAILVAVRPPPTSTGPQVPEPFTWDQLDVNLSVGSTTFSCALGCDFLLENPLDQADVGFLGLNLNYQNGDWLLSGLAQNIVGAMMFDFFDPNYKGSLLSVLGSLQIPQLQVVYTYASGGAATSFAFVGVVQVGLIQLRLFYQYASSDAGSKTAAQATPPGTQGSFLPNDAPVPGLTVQPASDPSNPTVKKAQTDWSFECDLGAYDSSGKTATLAMVIDAIVPGAADSLPPFVSGIEIPSADSGRSPITIKVAKHGADQIAFAFQVDIEHVSFTFTQIGDKDATKTKKLLRIAVDDLPKISNIPLIGDLIQPFDALEYVWVSDSGGLFKSEVTALNSMVLSADNPLYFSANVGQPADAQASTTDPVAIVPGHHFIVIQGNAVVLDHVFATASPTVPQAVTPSPTGETPVASGGTAASGAITSVSGASTSVSGASTSVSGASTSVSGAPEAGASGTGASGDVPATGPTSTVTAPASPPSKGQLTLNLGPLTISAISLQFQEQGGTPQISITLDATFAMGPIVLELIGFGFSIPLHGGITLDNFKSLLGDMSPLLSGMDIAFNQPPLLIAGGFEHDQDTYLGAVGISFPPYNFIGVGEYAILSGYKSVFLYAKLNGPIITLEFAQITGVRMGFGYNSFVRAPAINELTSFPFIDDAVTASAGSDPFNIVKTMTQTTPPWVTPKADEYWLAAGLSVSAFDCLTITAVAMLEIKSGGFDLAIYGDAVAMMPPDASSREECLVYVELGLVVDFNMSEGYFRVEAALAPTSFLLVPQCQLTGGFALVYWFGSNPHAEDWVFSVGGYHPQYQVPDWYPVPQRLGISFTIGSCLSIVGNCYFAVTPKVVMGGALIHVSLDLGPLQAWLDAQFDCLINFHPLHYMAEFRVSVGVSFNIDILFIHIHISASIGADLVVQGPEFGGTAHVDFWVFSFTVDFGASPNAKPALTLLQFWQMLHQPGPDVSSQNAIDLERVQAVVTYDPRADLEGTMIPSPLGTGTVPYKIPAPHVVETAALKYVLEDGNYLNPPKLEPEPTPPAAASGSSTGGTTGTATGAAAGSVTASDPSNTGQGTKWFVKGGTFKFRIQTEFALSYVSVTSALLPAEDGAGAEVPVLNGGPHPTKTNIFSRPMHVTTDIISELNVTIVETVSNKIIGGWTGAAFDTKSVPIGTWGKYSTDTDPSAGDASSLLTHDNATVPLPMGLLLNSPAPYLAPSAIPVFNASDASKMGVIDLRFVATMPGTNWFVPGYAPIRKATEDVATPGILDYTPVGPDLNAPSGVLLAPTQVSYLPTELTPTEQGETNQQLWDNLGQDWTQYASDKKNLVNDPTDGLLATIEGIFGWAQNTPPADTTGTTTGTTTSTAGTAGTSTATVSNPWQLKGDFPAKLVRSAKKDGTMVKDLEATYLALPRRAIVPPITNDAVF